LRKPKVHLGFGGENNAGMSDILIDKTPLEECIQKSTLKNLDYISAGVIPPNPAELIMSSKFDKIIEKLKEIYDVIFIDTPPVGLVTDGMLIMKNSDVSLYVVRASYSKRGIEKNIRKLQLSKQYNHLSVILNAVDQKDSYGNYGYGYGYYEEDVQKTFFSKVKDKFN
jgi:capsular exopolysaccharide synthesis family protein